VRENAWYVLPAIRGRAIGSAIGVGVVALAGIGVLRADAPALYAGLTGRALPLVIVSALAGLASLGLVVARRFVGARLAAAIAVTAVLLGWAAGQYPYLLVGQLTIGQAAAARPTLVALLIVLVIGSAILAPALWYMYSLFQKDSVSVHVGAHRR
jgi:cytochrome d ubiquinol oxidase subunit II